MRTVFGLLLLITIFSLANFFGPWWVTGLLSFIFGILWATRRWVFWEVSIVAAVTSLGFVFYFNHLQQGLPLTRVAGLFGLPQAHWLFAIIFIVAFVTALLGVSLGSSLRRLLDSVLESTP